MKKTLKLSLTFVLACVMLFAVAIIASAETTLVASGDIGKTDADSVIWEYTKDTETGKFTLTFSGSGKIAGFTKPELSPIYTYREKVDYLVIEDGITEIGANACYGLKKVATVVIPDSVKTIGRTAFRYCSGVTDFYMGSGVTKVDTDAFTPRNKAMKVHVKDLAAWCGIEFSSRFSNPVTAGDRKMYINGEIVTDLFLPAEVTSIGKYAFYLNTGLSKVRLHDNIKSIGYMSFASCSKLRYLEVNNCTFDAASAAFQNCTYLRNIYINNIKTWFSNTWTSTSSNPLYNDLAYAWVNGQDYVYKGVAGRVTKILVIPEGTEVLNKNAFYKRRDLEGVVIPSTVTTIEKDPFAQCMKGLTADGGNDQFRYVYGVAGSAAQSYVSSVSVRRFKEIGVDIEIVDVTGVSVNQDDQVLEIGSTIEAKATITPKDATDKHIIWTSSDLNVARVSRGSVTAIGAGQATITGSTTDGSFYDSFVVTVPEIAVTGLTIDKTEATITMGHTLTINATIAPVNATNVNLTWTSSNTAVATVKNGIVTPVGGGKATITATVGSFTAVCEVTVDVPTIEVTGIELDVTAALLAPAETLQLNATVTPADATDATVTWTSKNTAVATVVDGLVTAIADGEAIIEAKAGNVTATCTIKVETPAPEDIPVEEIALDVEELEIIFGETYQFEVIFTPEDTTERNLFWESTNEDVATIDENGLLTAIAPGITIITVLSEDNEDLYAECVVEVTAGKPVVGISLNKTTANVYVGDIVNLVVTFNPADATNKNVTWTSSNDSIVTVTDGVVTAVAGGVATVTATSEDGEFTATCKFIVAVGNETPPIEWN